MVKPIFEDNVDVMEYVKYLLSYDFYREACGLPDKVTVSKEDFDRYNGEIADFLSDKYDFLVNGVVYEEKDGEYICSVEWDIDRETKSEIQKEKALEVATANLEACISDVDMNDFDTEKMLDNFADRAGMDLDTDLTSDILEAFGDDIRENIREHCEVADVDQKYAADILVWEGMNYGTEFSADGISYKLEVDKGSFPDRNPEDSLRLFEYNGDMCEWQGREWCDRETMTDVIKDLLEGGKKSEQNHNVGLGH